MKTTIPEISQAYGEKSVILYRVENPLWLTDATIREDGRLTVTSGDKDNEWTLEVAAERKGFVLNALLQYVAPDFPEEADGDDRLLMALSAKFAGDENAFEDIERFLRATGNAPRRSAWIGSP
jgi:hypothetical protein